MPSTTTSGAGGGVDVSVVVPAFRAVDRIDRCLEALAAQTLALDRFEVVVVPNGPDDGTRERVARFRAENPRLRVVTITTDSPGVGNARNLGVAAASGRWITFVDDDDAVTPTFLAALLEAARPGVVPVAPVRDVDATDGTSTFDNYLSRQLLPRAGTTFGVDAAPSLIGFTTSKLVLRSHAARIPFRTTLRSGEDVVYWYELFDHAPFRLAAVPTGTNAVYERSVRLGTVSRRELTFDFAVGQRLDVVAALQERPPSRLASARVRDAFTRGQTGFVNRYLRAHPEEHPRVTAEIRARGLGDVIPYDVMNAGVARDLAILYGFVPYADTSALVAARRLHDRAVPVDVISNSLAGIRPRDDSGHLIAREFIDRAHEVQATPNAFNWYDITQFVLGGTNMIRRWTDEKGPYRSVYSRAMWPASHVLAARVKLADPEIRWIAEFSDPQVWNPYGERRAGDAYPNALWDELVDGLAAVGVPPPAERNVPQLVELLAFALADELVFTNDNQLAFMVDRLPEANALAGRVRDIAVVSPHPTLPKEYYHRTETEYPLDTSVVNIAYFGTFYSTRGLTEVVDALKSLDPSDRARLRLHVFTADPERLRESLAEDGLGDAVVPNPYVPFFEFLNLTTQMDVLLVNDARTSHVYERNPYLPSKWSDYAGSGRQVWAVVEDGSTLAGFETAYRSRLGDVESAASELRRMVSARERSGRSA